MSAELRFDTIDEEVFDRACSEAVSALKDEGTPGRLVEYYDTATRYAGSTFAGLGVNSNNSIDATDLLAVTSLNVSIGNHAIRRFLEDDSLRAEIADALEGLPTCAVQDVRDEDFSAMAHFYELVKKTLAPADVKSSNRWVTASKIVARKRPDLFPVRDRVVCGRLGIIKLNNYSSDWRVFRTIMRTREVADLLAELPSRINQRRENRSVVLGDETPLRLLDAALWMWSPETSEPELEPE